MTTMVHERPRSVISPPLAKIVRKTGALLAVAFLFSGFSTWTFNTGALPLPPLAFMLVVLFLACAVILLDPLGSGNTRIKGWSAVSACLAMLAFLWSSGSEVALQEAQTRILSALLLVGFSVLMAEESTGTVTRFAIAVSTLLAVALNIWEITHPMSFSMALGRSAGLYMNPNIAGAALVTGMLMALPVVPARAREAFVLVVGIGVFLTLSRAALLCFGVVLVILLGSNQLGAKRISLMVVGSLFILGSLTSAVLASGELSYLNGGAEQFVKQRLGIGSREELNADASASSRSQVVLRALDLFGDRPLTGFGTGATVEWSEAESTHNIYARHLAEYGVLGAVLMPILLLLAWPRNDQYSVPVYRSTGRAFVVFVALWGMFSHNVADDSFVLIGLALTTALPTRRRPEYDS
jgi:O-antigen ligase